MTNRMRGRVVVICASIAMVTVLGAAEPAIDQTPGLTGPVGPAAMSCSGIGVTVGDDLQEAIDTHGPGTTFCLSAGTYRLTSALEPQRGDSLIGSPGAILSGAQVLTGWQQADRFWITRGFLPVEPDTHGQCETSTPICTYTEDVFFDKHRLRRVSEPERVTAGTVYADYAHNTISVGDDPRGHLLEQAVAPSLISSTADDVTVADLVVEEAANDAQVGAVESRQVSPRAVGYGWRVLHNEVRLNHGVGIGMSDRATVSGNFIHDQGQLGFDCWGDGSIINDNEISRNNVAGYSADWEAGGGKSWMTERYTVTHNYVHDNIGPGLWADGGNIDMHFAYNKIDDNWAAGIQYEISYDANIEHNEVSRNGRRHKGWAWDAGIEIQSSGGNSIIEVAHNLVSDNANGITLIDSDDRSNEEPAPHGPHVVHNIWVHDNTTILRADQKTGAVEDTGNTAAFTANNNRFESDSYILSPKGGSHFMWQSIDLDWNGWRASGNDLMGLAEVVAAHH